MRRAGFESIVEAGSAPTVMVFVMPIVMTIVVTIVMPIVITIVMRGPGLVGPELRRDTVEFEVSVASCWQD